MVIDLPPQLAALYGRLSFPPHPGRPYVIGNFVTTLDGVVSLNIPGHSGGAEISGHNKHDRMIMGVLRAISDAVVVGAGTLRTVPNHLWTAEYIYPQLADAYGTLRANLGKLTLPLNVIVTASGRLDFSLPVFHSDGLQVLIVTTANGAAQIQAGQVPGEVQVESTGEQEQVTAGQVLEAIRRTLGREVDTVLVEGGPHLMADFMAERKLDELFLTLAPQIAGRDVANRRPALVEGRQFAPERPVWGRLVGVRQSESHLFLRYTIRPEET
jgi:riboflavin biosynthesis pyrimidine reductase